MGGRARDSVGAVALAAAFAVMSTSGCTTDASGEVRGGGLRPGYDASGPPPVDFPVTEPTFTDAAPTTWRGVYRDFFGRRSESTCAGTVGCHESASATGAKRSGFVCADVDGCWASLRTAVATEVGQRALVQDSDRANPSGAYLFKVISYRTADGTLVPNRRMPQLPTDYAFNPVAIDRMQAWIAAGATNN